PAPTRHDAGPRLDGRIRGEGRGPSASLRARRETLAGVDRDGAGGGVEPRRGPGTPEHRAFHAHGSERRASRHGRGGDGIRMRLRIGLLVLALLPAKAMSAWTYPEHRAMTAKGIQTLDP